MDEKITYELDAQDRLIYVSPSWESFAINNDANELTLSAIKGRPLFEFIVDPETREIYRMLLKQVRSSSESLSFKIRCDSPSQMRLLQLVVASPDNENVVIDSNLLQSMPQNSGPLLERRVDRSGELLRICSWCLRSKVGSEWLSPAETAQSLGLFESSPVPKLTHGMCEDCFKEATSIGTG